MNVAAETAVGAGGPDVAGSDPVASVVVAAYNARERIDIALRALAAQDFAEPYEVIVVDSGTDGCAEHVEARHPWVRVVRSARRLYAGGARNAGVVAARGRYVAFCPDDGLPNREWLRLRVDKHREGFDAVAGSITNGTPYHPIGCADYFAEYTALIPSRTVLEQQKVPHCLSYTRSLLDRVGPYPEDVFTGEDTLLNERCLAAGASIGVEPGAQIAHRNLRRLAPYLRHHWRHGQGLAQCVDLYGHQSPIGWPEQAASIAALRGFGLYPALRWWKGLARVARGRPRWIASYVAVSPLLWAAFGAIAGGALSERSRLGSADGRGRRHAHESGGADDDSVHPDGRRQRRRARRGGGNVRAGLGGADRALPP